MNDKEKLDCFTHNGQHYEIASTLKDRTYTVRVYDSEGNPANGFSYSVTVDQKYDLKTQKFPYDALTYFADTAKTDFVECKYDEMLKLLSKPTEIE